ncbi:PD-(D/E)XK nuclease family protein [bacterium]|nr:PD-(D/E)XK nuclease family protein [bacterium]
MDLNIYPSRLASEAARAQVIADEGVYLGEYILDHNSFMNLLVSKLNHSGVILTPLRARMIIKMLIADNSPRFPLLSSVEGLEGELYRLISVLKKRIHLRGITLHENLIEGKKWREIYDLYREYEDFLDNMDMKDTGDLLQDLTASLDSAGLKKWDKLILRDFAVMEEDEDYLLSNLAEILDLELRLDIPKELIEEYKGRKGRSSFTANAKITGTDHFGGSYSHAHLLNPWEEWEKIRDLTLSSISSGKSITVVCLNEQIRDLYSRSMDQEAIEHYCGSVPPISNEPSVRMFNALLSTVTEGFDLHKMISLISSGRFDFPGTEHVMGLLKSSAERYEKEIQPVIDRIKRFCSQILDLNEAKSPDEMKMAFSELYTGEINEGEALWRLFEEISKLKEFMEKIGYTPAPKELVILIGELAGMLPSGQAIVNALAPVRLLNLHDAMPLIHDVLVIPGLNSGIFPSLPSRLPFFFGDESSKAFSGDDLFAHYMTDVFKLKYVMGRSKEAYLFSTKYDQDNINTTPSGALSRLDPWAKKDFSPLPEFRVKREKKPGALDTKRILRLSKMLAADEISIELKSFLGYCGRAPSKKKLSSPSAMETFAQCPYKYFLQYVIKPEKSFFEKEDKLNMTIGSIYHNTLFACREMIQKKVFEKPEFLDNLSKEIDKIVHAGDLSPLEGVMLEKRSASILGNYLRSHIDLLKKDEKRSGEFYELNLGFKPRDPEMCDANSIEEVSPITLIDRAIKIGGRIDRVDKIQGKHLLIDYKKKANSRKRALDMNVLFQWILYEKLFISAGLGNAASFMYSGIEDGVDVIPDPARRDEVLEFMELLISMWEAGEFPFDYPEKMSEFTRNDKGILENESKCGWCNYRDLCIRRDKLEKSY